MRNKPGSGDRRVGILGGSFNPPHVGHLALAETVLELGLADEVCLIPAAIPPHKATPRQADAPTRLAMTNLLAEEDPRIFTDDLELHRAGASYTIDTLHELRRKHPHCCYRLIIGSDLAKTFASWRDYKEILRLAPPLVAERPDEPFHDDRDFVNLTSDEITVIKAGRFDMRPVDVSSTKVRALLESGAAEVELLHYLTPAVLSFIRAHRLYTPHPVESPSLPG